MVQPFVYNKLVSYPIIEQPFVYGVLIITMEQPGKLFILGTHSSFILGTHSSIACHSKNQPYKRTLLVVTVFIV